ncbi:MAG: NADP-dependent oxidoreductase [Caldilineaceae bacterium]|nr:NADP-dependent oxidoreductase [Caldilineaceae bacterium]MCY4089713.1 NADP-dependent oxidoreductase [Caldilineaceae bacterium]MCY4115737.1 NADP-dependent oxidoreductase [Caldilineaceae bacterium]MDE0428852.1 NADP-dependent oxidoreductase [Caldilineaceae bacterium]
MTTITSREVHLRSRPHGLPSADNFALVETELPAPAGDQVLIRNRFISVDPYMRGRMRDTRSYTPPFGLDEPLTGGAVGEVISSASEEFDAGDFVLHMLGWREYALAEARGLTKVDPSLAPLQSYLGVLGMPGMTAYVGLLDIGEPQPGETVFVSGAAGAVGAQVCQIAKIKGCRVVGTAGSAAKTRWLEEVAGVDATINYKETSNLRRALKQACPDGIDVYFENVGGAHLEAALQYMNNWGRIVVCGMISQYNATAAPPGPANLVLMIGRRLRMQGFIVSDHPERRDDFVRDVSGWMKEGRLKWEETVFEGIERAPEAFIGLFHGENLGKMLVKV